LCTILIESGTALKVARLIKMCLNESYSRVRIGKQMSDVFSIKNGLKQGDVLSPLPIKSVLGYAIRRLEVNQGGLKLNVHTTFRFMLMGLLYCCKSTYYNDKQKILVIR
jgi:hypothetical protein